MAAKPGVASIFLLLSPLCCTHSAHAVPSVVLNNGVDMPRVAVAPMKIDASGALVETILNSGLTHIFTAEDYYNQAGIKSGLRGRPRSSFFITSMTSPCIHSASAPKRNVSDPDACYNLTVAEFQGQLDELGVEQIDLMMLHGPSRPYGFHGPCGFPELNKAQWRAYSDMYKAGKARAIGVSNYCESCLEPILADRALVVPAVNQLQFHIGMGYDPEGITSYLSKHGIILQAYSPLASGALIDNVDTVRIGKAHGKNGAQVAYRWITQLGASLVTSASNSKHLAEDADVFEWNLTSSELQQLSALSCESNPELCQEHSGTPSWGCTQFQNAIAV